MERMRRARNAMLIFYYVFTACGAVFCLQRDGTVYNLLLAIAAFALPAVPYVLYRVCRLRPVYLLEIVFDGFVLAAVPFASLFGGYDFVPYWDKILHFLSGFLFAVLGTAVYFSCKPGHRLEREDAFERIAVHLDVRDDERGSVGNLGIPGVAVRRRPAAGCRDRRGRHHAGHDRVHAGRADYRSILLEIPAAPR